MIARLQITQKRRGNGRHACRRRARSFRAFEKGHARLEHGIRGVCETAVGVAFNLVLEARLGFGGAVVNEARRQEQRLGRFTEGGAERAAVNEKRLGMKVCDAVWV